MNWAVEDYESIKFDFSNEEIMAILQVKKELVEEDSWKLYFDGASKALRQIIGIVLISFKGEYCSLTRLDFNCTNNVVE